MKTSEILDFETNYKKLSDSQKASFYFSLSWKKISLKMLKDAIRGKKREGFHEAVLWCGKYGHALRGASKEDVDYLVDHLWDNVKEIKNGQFKWALAKNAHARNSLLSLASKICHLLNPRCYPLIYDSNMRNELNAHTLESFCRKMADVQKEVRKNGQSDIFRMDSVLWANQTNLMGEGLRGDYKKAAAVGTGHAA